MATKDKIEALDAKVEALTNQNAEILSQNAKLMELVLSLKESNSTKDE